MDDIRGVRLRKRARDQARDPQRAHRRHRSGLEDPIEGFAVDQLHREVRSAVTELADRVDRDDTGVGDARGGAGLAREPLRHHRIGRDLRGGHLDRDRAIEPELAAPVDGAERASAEHALDLEPIDDLADEARARGVGERVTLRGPEDVRHGGGIDRRGLDDDRAALGAEPPRLVRAGRTRGANPHLWTRVAVAGGHGARGVGRVFHVTYSLDTLPA